MRRLAGDGVGEDVNDFGLFGDWLRIFGFLRLRGRHAHQGRGEAKNKNADDAQAKPVAFFCC